ncbi:MAG: ECF transporter S component [Lachnospiraceae bacterium]|nr:ECF transporter S component [Lachnospiraceae bacterium]
MKNSSFSVRKLAGLAILTAIVVVLQLVGSQIHFGPFSISLVLIPIVVGAALFGPLAGAWLGLVFSVIVLIMDSAAFMNINAVGTVLTVLIKGTAAGFVAGLIYNVFRKWAMIFKNVETGKESWSINFGVVMAAIICPIVNTGLFLLGCVLFFLPTIREWGVGSGYTNVVSYMFLGLVGGNFLVELLINLILSPIIVQLIRLGRRN